MSLAEKFSEPKITTIVKALVLADASIKYNCIRLKEALVESCIIDATITYNEFRANNSLMNALMTQIAYSLSQEVGESSPYGLNLVSEYELFHNLKNTYVIRMALQRDGNPVTEENVERLFKNRVNLQKRLRRLRDTVLVEMELFDTPDDVTVSTSSSKKEKKPKSNKPKPKPKKLFADGEEEGAEKTIEKEGKEKDTEDEDEEGKDESVAEEGKDEAVENERSDEQELMPEEFVTYCRIVDDTDEEKQENDNGSVDDTLTMDSSMPSEVEVKPRTYKGQRSSEHVTGDMRDLYESDPRVLDCLLEFLGNDIRPEMVISEPCCGRSQKLVAGLKERGFNNIVASDIEKYSDDIIQLDVVKDDIPRCDFIITNPPFSLKKEIVTKLFRNDVPFAVILPLDCLGTVYMKSLMNAHYGCHIVMIPTAFRFKKQDGVAVQVGPIVWFVGNLRVSLAMPVAYLYCDHFEIEQV